MMKNVGRIKTPYAKSERLPLPIVGKIKVGMKTERGYPKSVDYFIPKGKYADLFTQAYGDTPHSIQIVFIDDDPAKVCIERYEYRDNEGKLIAYSDGEVFYVYDGAEQVYKMLTATEFPNIMNIVARKYPNQKTAKGDDGWDITLTMYFLIPCVQGIAGLWEFKSQGSASTIPQIRDTFDTLLKSRGGCKGMLFDLNVEFSVSNKPGDKSKYPVVSLVPNQSASNVDKVKEAMGNTGVLALNE